MSEHSPDQLDTVYKERRLVMQQLEDEGIFTDVNQASTNLQAIVRTKVLGARLAGHATSISAPLQEMALGPTARLADEAAAILSGLGEEHRAGFTPPVQVEGSLSEVSRDEETGLTHQC